MNDGYAVQQHHAFAFNVDFYSVGIPLLLLVLPWVVTRVLRTEASVRFPYWPNFGWLFAAAFAWYWAIQLPNVPITSETTSTTVHLMGGAFVGPLLFVYLVKAYDIPTLPTWWMRYLVLYAAVGGVFGMSNELMEFCIAKAGLITIDLGDASWDLVANFVGFTATYLIAELCGYWPSRHHSTTLPQSQLIRT